MSEELVVGLIAGLAVATFGPLLSRAAGKGWTFGASKVVKGWMRRKRLMALGSEDMNQQLHLLAKHSKEILDELKPNDGDSVKDKVLKIEQDVSGIRHTVNEAAKSRGKLRKDFESHRETHAGEHKVITKQLKTLIDREQSGRKEDGNGDG